MLIGLICIFLARIESFVSGECGIPAKPSHGQLMPDKPVYEEGDKVAVICEPNYRLFGEDTNVQKCNDGIWLGKLSACLQNLVYGRSIHFFGSPSSGTSNRPHGGFLIYDVTDAKEIYFFDFFLQESTKHAYIYFHGSFHVTDQHGTALQFDQTVLAFNRDISFYQPCPKAASGDYFECISPDERFFTGAKVEISLLDKTINASMNSVQVKLQLDTNGFVVLDVADKDCGTPPIPLHGSVSISAFGFIRTYQYSCSPRYSLHGDVLQTCDLSNYPNIVWQSKTPECVTNLPRSRNRISRVRPTTPVLEGTTPTGISNNTVEGIFGSLSTTQIAVLSTTGIVVLILIAFTIARCIKNPESVKRCRPSVLRITLPFINIHWYARSMRRPSNPLEEIVEDVPAQPIEIEIGSSASKATTGQSKPTRKIVEDVPAHATELEIGSSASKATTDQSKPAGKIVEDVPAYPVELEIGSSASKATTGQSKPAGKIVEDVPARLIELETRYKS